MATDRAPKIGKARRTGTFVPIIIALAITSCLKASAARAHPLAWTLQPVSGPSPRFGHAMAYDSARGVTVLFGGLNNAVPSGETWEWNGAVWSQRFVSGPTARGFHAMAYDAARGVTVLFGGATNDVFWSAETWEWDGIAWNPRASGGPPGRARHAMAYDSSRGVTVLFGGIVGVDFNGDIYSGDTWEWNGTAWTQRMVSGPSPRALHSIVFDSARGATVLFGGYRGSPFYHRDDTWEWNGTAWTLRQTGGPLPRIQHAMVYDSARSTTVLFSGYTAYLPHRVDDTWEWAGGVGGAWVRRTITCPAGRESHAMAFDAARGATVLFGGYTDSGYSDETWVLAPIPCPADFNGGGLSVQDIFDFLNAWLAVDPRADFNQIGGLTVQDIFDFLNTWLAGCP